MKIAELRQAIEDKKVEARNFTEGKDLEGAKKAMEELRALKDQLKIEEELEETEKRDLVSQKEERKADDLKMEKRTYDNAVKELMKGEVISTRAIAVNGADTKAVVPVEFLRELEKLEAGYGSLEAECEVINVTSQTGKRPVSTLGGKLTKLTPGQKIPEGALKFEDMAYDVASYGEIVAVDNGLMEDSAIDLFATIKENFAIKSVNTKNEAILGALEANKDKEVELNGDVVGTIIEAIDGYAPSVRRFVKVLANSALRAKIKNSFYEASGKDQRVTVDGDKVFIDGHEVIEFDSTLATGDAQGYVAPMKGVKFFKRTGVDMAISDQAYWESNATAIRVVTRFDVKGLDNEMVKPVKLKNGLLKAKSK